MKIEAYGTLTVVDVWYENVSKETREFLNTYYRTYNDRMIDEPEHLLDIVSANERDAKSKSKHAHVRKEIKALGKLAEENNAAYVRFVCY